MITQRGRVMNKRKHTILSAGIRQLAFGLPVVLAGTAVWAAPPAGSHKVSFTKDVRPILAEACFACHGPDAARRAGGFRLDQRASAVAKGVITPGKPDKSKLIQRITAGGDAGLMPPAAFHKRLTPVQVAALKGWIAEGAEYRAHWAFVSPAKSIPVPAVHNSAWCRTPIDKFILARLETEGLKPSPQASRVEWLRRVSLDLTGIPPTVEQRDQFLADKSPTAFEKVVDRLLASTAFGERMASPWLDTARYADSYGYQSDQLSPTWPYRDWVVSAFNKNLPYNQFISWQIAGDLLPGSTREQRLATAFNRLHRMTNEGGSVVEEWRMEGVTDRVRTLGTAVLGLTLECARCNDHKYDPVTTREYYSLASFLNNIDEYGMYDRSDIVPSPSLLLPNAAQEKALATAISNCSTQEEAFHQSQKLTEADLKTWLASSPAPVIPDQTGKFSLDKLDAGSIFKNEVDGSKENGAHADEVGFVPGHKGQAVLLDGENNISFSGLGRFTRHTPYTIAFWMKDPRLVDAPAVVYSATDGTDAGPFGYDLMVDKGVLTARMFRHWPGNAIAVRTKTAISKNAWTHVAVTYDGSSRGAGLKIYVDGKLADQFVLRDKMVKGNGTHNLVFGQRFRDRGFKGGAIDEVAIFNRDISPIEVQTLVDGHSLADLLKKQDPQNADLKAYYLSAIAPQVRAEKQKLADARMGVWSAEDPQTEVAVMEEMQGERPTFVLARGRYDAPQDDSTRVHRVVPASMPPLPTGMKPDRLALANWLTSPVHPLTARVEVNRLWAQMFGKGIVETAEDFGIQGKPPTHPELLDWMARSFIDGGWNIKGLLRTIALSSTYRQSSQLTPALKLRDTRNELYARGPSQRLSAEQIRDSVLAAAGLLDNKMGGPPVSPYQPGDLWRESNSMSPGYRQSVGTDLYRRSLYTVIKRTAPMPNMLAFDTVSREFCIARRQPTNTPMQALVLLNDTQFVEAARCLAEHSIAHNFDKGDAAVVADMFRQLAVREPSSKELKLLTDLLEAQKSLFAKDAEMATQLIHIGDSKPSAAIPPNTLAATTVVAQTIINTDAVVWNR